jgi:hypothetical protein
MSGHFYCHLCELAGRPTDKRFKVPADAIGRALMEQHVLEPHPAQRLRSAVPGGESVDIALTGEDAA